MSAKHRSKYSSHCWSYAKSQLEGGGNKESKKKNQKMDEIVKKNEEEIKLFLE